MNIHTLVPIAFIAAAAHALHAAPDAYAYGANTGWINCNTGNGVYVGDFILSGSMYSANLGWISMGDGTPANGYAYSNASAGDFGVNQDGLGNLSGYAYSANTGWINFGWATVNDPNRPRFSLATGAFAGFAYSANTGWINLGTGYLAVGQVTRTDSDGDGMDDAWESANFGNLTTAGIGSDFDGDGQSDAAESIAGTGPKAVDDYLRITSLTPLDSGLTQTSVVFSSNEKRLYRIEHCTDLATWSDSGLGTFSPDNGPTTEKTFTVPGSTSRFYRVVSVRPINP